MSPPESPSSRIIQIRKCTVARGFVLRVVPGLAYLCGVAKEVVRASVPEEGLPRYGLLSLETLGSCVQGGFDCPEKLALSWIGEPGLSRVAIHRDFAQLGGFLDEGPESEDVGGLRRRVQRAVGALERTAR